MKKNQHGSAAVGILIAIVALFVLIGAVFGVSYISAYNAGNTMEQGIKATHQNNQNILATYSQKVLEAAQVTDMMRDDLVRVTKAAIEGRYGADGSKAVFQAITETNPQVSEKLYLKLQQIVESGRDEFKVNQTTLIDKKRVYQQELGSFWRGMWMRIAGYPKINLDDYKVVITEGVEATFKSGKESAPIRLRAPQQ
ncbi:MULTISPECIES: hypothetical protein [unclassified Variovorax]|uniref:hypothetical protein n=1 Tax=unclassified Variovorax TaxID=663243 RepID=UPI00076BDE80|nr:MULTISPECIES: hypothetical protein [unclassified Variovorax]KWT98021.1 hypothetical protein APY03_0692 [Variovorax sp. WDL1]PNG50511.1 hypothetical protein CHC06_06135 [Variovorax sp. B2]PNG51384.1 hypothetical protein CHC07_06041 [Variovorax sp. B4]VTV17662.1 hypothetical protein WDL1P1_00569 [Variovorax sp. WDL1]